MIDTDAMNAHLISFLPYENELSDSELEDIVTSVITIVGDNEDNYSEVLCKSLRNAGIINKAKSSISVGSIKREKSHQREVEFFNSDPGELWDSFLNSLVDVCPILPGGGYTIPSRTGVGFYANVSEKVTIPRSRKTPRSRL